MLQDGTKFTSLFCCIYIAVLLYVPIWPVKYMSIGVVVTYINSKKNIASRINLVF